MKTKVLLLTTVLLVIGMLCGCGAEPSPAGTTDAASETQTAEAAPQVGEEKLYADYLTNGGYRELLPDYDDPDAYYEAEACLADIDDDGVRELLIHFTNKAMASVRGYPAVTVLLGVRDGAVKRLGYAENPGGSGGGDYLFIKYDTITKKHVLEYEEYVRDGMFFSTYALHYFDVKALDAEEKEYGLVGSGDVAYKQAHVLRSSTFNTEGAYAEDAQRVRKETDLCVESDGFVNVYRYDDDYISHEKYDAIRARFVEPTDPAYQMKPVTTENPIPKA